MHGRIGNWQKPKVDVFSLQSLIAWLERRPANSGYDECNADNCMIFHWLRSIDADAEIGPGHSFMYIAHGENRDFREFLDIAFKGERTFGAALERARSALAK